jgi:hypothetical protein
MHFVFGAIPLIGSRHQTIVKIISLFGAFRTIVVFSKSGCIYNFHKAVILKKANT